MLPSSTATRSRYHCVPEKKPIGADLTAFVISSGHSSLYTGSKFTGSTCGRTDCLGITIVIAAPPCTAQSRVNWHTYLFVTSRPTHRPHSERTRQNYSTIIIAYRASAVTPRATTIINISAPFRTVDRRLSCIAIFRS